MHASVLSWWPLLLAAGAAGPAGAQPDPAPASPAYRSAFEDYRPWGEQAVASWKDTNDTVGRIGGWKAYAQEASGGTLPRAAPEPSSGRNERPAQPAPTGERSHGHHGHHR